MKGARPCGRACLSLHPSSARMRRHAVVLHLLLSSLASPALAQEQSAAPAGPPLASFTALRVSVTPVQSWHADSTGWSRTVDWPAARAQFDSTLQAVLEERGLGKKWLYASDLVRIAKRNPTYATDPHALGIARLRTMEMRPGNSIPSLLADNLRPFTALGDSRYVLIPFELRAAGDGVVLRLALVDTRSRNLVWAGDLSVPGGARMPVEAATRLANLIIEP